MGRKPLVMGRKPLVMGQTSRDGANLIRVRDRGNLSRIYDGGDLADAENHMMGETCYDGGNFVMEETSLMLKNHMMGETCFHHMMGETGL
jgi:hypothetical protein